MDEKALGLLARAIAEGATSGTWVVLAVAALAAGVAAYLGAYFAKKAEHLATRENFREALDQMKEQTKATKAIEAEIAEGLHYRTQLLLPRIDSYKALWAETEVARPTRSQSLSTADKEVLRQKLTSWYYDKGNGIFLSVEAGKHFRDARQTLAGIDDAAIKGSFSRLRTTLKTDLKVYGALEETVDLGT